MPLLRVTVWSRIYRPLGAAIGVLFFLALLVEGLAWLCREPGGHTTAVAAAGVGNHTVREWTGPRVFHEAPMLAALVKAGKLPPVAQRLPDEPQVIVPPQQCGPYGGVWRRFGTDPMDIGTYVIHRISYPNLLRWGPMADKLLPHVATRWEASPDAKDFTLHLRRGIRWSDGVPFTSDDILFWYKYVLQNDKITPSIPREYKRAGKLMTVDAPDAYTVHFHFAAPNGRFVENLAAMPGFEMIDVAAHYFKQFHPAFASEDALTVLAKAHKYDYWYQYFASLRDWQNPDAPRLWPWVVTVPPPARTIVLERNPYYWKVDPQGNQLPYMDRVTFEIFDPETINLKAISGEFGMQGRHLRFDNYPLLMDHAQSGHYRVLRWLDSNGGTNNLALNMNSKDSVKHTLFNDKRFRIALSEAIDRDEINQACFFGIAVPRQCAPPKNSPYYDKAYAEAYTKFDPSAANRLLDEIGLTRRNADGVRLLPNGEPLYLRIDCTPMSCSLSALELVAKQWTAVGVKADVNVLARQLFYQRKAALMPDVTVWYGADEWNPLLDPRWFFPWKDESNQGIAYAAWFRSNGKKGETPPPDMQRCMTLYGQIENTPDPAEQRRLFKQIVDLNRKNLWVIGTVGEAPVLYVVSDTFRNVPDVAVSGWQFRGPANTAPECYSIVGGGR